ncbi:MAG TPA: hypothetical protein PKE06_25765 [Flavilitoribacter sp.]|nr:hypothetical protein [Flavilitoribacter sp.]HMQ88924.1 hypothetical protein [Flavilitoribacter sp.]
MITQRAAPKFEIGITPGSDPSGIRYLADSPVLPKSDMVALTRYPEETDYLIHAEENQYWLSRLKDPFPLFKKVDSYGEQQADFFPKQIETVAKWEQVRFLDNPETGIGPEEIQLEFYIITAPGEYAENAPKELADWWNHPVLAYGRRGETWYYPAFQLKVRNSGLRPFWFSALFLGSDFSITNRLLPQQLLEPGQEDWARMLAGAYSNATIPVQVEDILYQQDIQVLTNT